MEKVNHDNTGMKHPHFIVVTAVGQEKITEDAFNKGANYYIMKPFNNKVLVDRIKTVSRVFQNHERKNEETMETIQIREEDLETRVTNMLHEIGIPDVYKRQ